MRVPRARRAGGRARGRDGRGPRRRRRPASGAGGVRRRGRGAVRLLHARASSSRRPISCAASPTRRTTRSARRSRATSAAAPATRRSSTPCTWRRRDEHRHPHARRGHAAPATRRADAVPKVTGEFAYSSDLHAAGMLWGQTVRSPHAHARILAIDVSEALTMAGVHAVLTHDDVPGAEDLRARVRRPARARDRSRALLRRGRRDRRCRGARAGAPRGRRGRSRRLRAARAGHRSGARDGDGAAPPRPPDDGRTATATTRGPTSSARCVIRRGDPDAEADVTVEGVYDDRPAGSGLPRPRVGDRDPGRRGRHRHPRRDAVAPRRPRPGRALPRPRAGAGADPPRRCRRRLRRARGPLHADPRRDAGAAHRAGR